MKKIISESNTQSQDNSKGIDISNVSEEKFKLLLESVKDYGIFQMDPEGYIQSWNTGAENIKGYKAQEVIGKHFSIFYVPSDVQKKHPQYELEQAKEKGRYEEEGWRLRKDGTMFWANIIISAIRDHSGKLLGFGKVTRDLTERREAEEKLRLSEERARKMFEAIKDYAIVMLNPDGTIATWNEGARRINGWEAQEVIGKYFSIFHTEQDIQMGKCEYELHEALESGRFEEEGWRKRKDGTKFWASVLLTTLWGSDGKLMGFSKVTRDMTDRKRADDLLKMSNANLELRVAERTKELLQANRDLQDAIKVRDEFLSIASHELRTPLTPLKMQVQGLLGIFKKKDFHRLSDDRVKRMAETCNKSLLRLNKLLDNLLDVSRINLGKLSLNYETFDLVEMAESIIERHKYEIDAYGSSVNLKSEAPVIGSFDQLRIEQVFSNLLFNAMKYGANKPIEIEISMYNNQAIITFQDQGIGIPEGDFDRIFQRFERIKTDKSIGGLGLGLFITRQIVEAHGGHINVESTLKIGSRFKVMLPIMKTEKI